MKKAIICIVVLLIGMVVSVGFVLSNRADIAQRQVVRSSQVNLPQKLKVRVPQKIYSFNNRNDLIKFLLKPPAYPDKYVDHVGLGTSEADSSTKEVWAVAINDGRNPPDCAQAGFDSVAIENTSGIPWRALVKASFDVSMIQGGVNLWLAICSPSGGGATALYYTITSPGTHEAASNSFDIKSGHKYFATAFIECLPPKDQAAAGKARILDIKWNIEF